MNRVRSIATGVFVLMLSASFLAAGWAGFAVAGLGLVVALLGTLGSLLLSYPKADIRAAGGVANNAYATTPPSAEDIVDTLMEISLRSRGRDPSTLEEMEEQATVSFLKRALGMLVDGYPEDELHDIMATEMSFFERRRVQHEGLFRYLTRIAPNIGVAGGLVSLMAAAAMMDGVAVNMAVFAMALAPVLYGIVLGSMVFAPIAENIRARTRKELLMQHVVADGVKAIRREQNPYRLAKKLESFLTPAARRENQQSFEEIRDLFRAIRGQEEESEREEEAQTPFAT